MHCSFCYSNRTWMYFHREVFPSYVSFFDIFENSLLGNITPLPLIKTYPAIQTPHGPPPPRPPLLARRKTI